MEHEGFYVLCGTAFPILLLAAFAADTAILRQPAPTRTQVLRRAKLRLMAAMTLAPFLGLMMCAEALAFETDSLAFRLIVFLLLLASGGAVLSRGVDAAIDRLQSEG